MTGGRNRRRRRSGRRRHILHVRLNDEQMEWIEMMCLLRNSSKSSVIRLFFAHKDAIKQIVEKII